MASAAPSTSFNPGGPTPGSRSRGGDPGRTNAEILGLTLDQRGRIVGGGYATVEDGGSFEVDSAVVRFLPDGTLDPSFNPGGPRPGAVVTEAGPDWNVVFRVALDQRGRIVTAGDAFVGVGAGLYAAALQDEKLIASGECDQPATGRDVCLRTLRP